MVYNSLEHYMEEVFGVEKFSKITKKELEGFFNKK